jgi:hypothetical protein
MNKLISLSELQMQVLKFADATDRFEWADAATAIPHAPIRSVEAAAEHLVYCGLLERMGRDSRDPVPYQITGAGSAFLRSLKA